MIDGPPPPPVPLPAEPETAAPAILQALLAGAGPAPVPAVEGAERIGEGFGLDGRLARVRLAAAAGWPATVVVKRTHGGLGRVEARLLPALACRAGLDLPRLLGAWVDDGEDAALLVLEDLAPAVQGDMLVGATRVQAVALAREEARFHAALAGIDAGDPDLGGLSAWGTNPERFAELIERRTAGALERWGALFDPFLRTVTARLPARVEDLFAILRAAPGTLVHADLHLDNVMFRADGRPVILDWSHARYGPAVVDLARFLVEVVDDRGRAEWSGDALDAWHAAMTDAGAPPPPETLGRHLRLALAHLWGTAVSWAGRTDALMDEPRVQRITRAVIERGGAALRQRYGGDADALEADLDRGGSFDPETPKT